MSDVTSTVIGIIREVLKDEGQEVPYISAASLLEETGLDSFSFAVVVARLQAEYGYDPFLDGTVEAIPVTVGDLAAHYEAGLRSTPRTNGLRHA